jgi:hypothetical protein
MDTNLGAESRHKGVEESTAETQPQPDVVSTAWNWMHHVIGIFKDEPAFDEVIRLGKEFRKADRLDEDGGR